MEDKPKNKSLEVIDGCRVQLEAKIVEDIFLNRYDPAKAALLKRRGRLVVVSKGGDGRPKLIMDRRIHF